MHALIQECLSCWLENVTEQTSAPTSSQVYAQDESEASSLSRRCPLVCFHQETSKKQKMSHICFHLSGGRGLRGVLDSRLITLYTIYLWQHRKICRWQRHARSAKRTARHCFLACFSMLVMQVLVHELRVPVLSIYQRRNSHHLITLNIFLLPKTEYISVSSSDCTGSYIKAQVLCFGLTIGCQSHL